jgi:hypothetical protein
MGWAETKAKARRVAHSTFSLPAVYTAPGGAQTPCSARKHSRLETFGDLDREQFAQRIEDVTRVLVDALVITPVEKGIVTFGNNEGSFRIVNVLPREGDFIPCEVVVA